MAASSALVVYTVHSQGLPCTQLQVDEVNVPISKKISVRTVRIEGNGAEQSDTQQEDGRTHDPNGKAITINEDAAPAARSGGPLRER